MSADTRIILPIPPSRGGKAFCRIGPGVPGVGPVWTSVICALWCQASLIQIYAGVIVACVETFSSLCHCCQLTYTPVSVIQFERYSCNMLAEIQH